VREALLLAVAASIAATTGQPCQPSRARPQGGGCINEAWVLEDASGPRWFVKLNAAHRAAMFSAEAEGLGELAATGTVRVPTPIARGTAQGHSWLALEYLDLSGRGGEAALGCALAAQHRHTAPAHGWHRDNTIGATLQTNLWEADWPHFYAERRLRPQLEGARRRGAVAGLYEPGLELLECLPAFFSVYRPVPSLLHGDLWGGNWAALPDGTPVIFDPAVYYGDREADLAMTELFGGFGSAFYAAYREAWPVDEGYAARRSLYNLYHILNHYNLFGGGYATRARQMIAALLAACR
jgi:fructosamine-3-kinase